MDDKDLIIQEMAKNMRGQQEIHGQLLREANENICKLQQRLFVVSTPERELSILKNEVRWLEKELADSEIKVKELENKINILEFKRSLWLKRKIWTK